METTDRIQEIIHTLEDAISYNDMDIVVEAKDELIFVLQDMDSDFHTNMFCDDDI